MNERIWASIALMVVFAYGSYLTASQIWDQPEPFLFGAFVGWLVGLGLHYLARLRWKEKERNIQDYASYVANTVSLVYLKHAPCPACGHSPQDEYADGFGSHAAMCPILTEITEFGKAPGD